MGKTRFNNTFSLHIAKDCSGNDKFQSNFITQ